MGGGGDLSLPDRGGPHVASREPDAGSALDHNPAGYRESNDTSRTAVPVEAPSMYVDVVTRKVMDAEQACELYAEYARGASKAAQYRCSLPHRMPGLPGTYGLVNLKYRCARTTHHSLDCQRPGSRAGFNTPGKPRGKAAAPLATPPATSGSDSAEQNTSGVAGSADDSDDTGEGNSQEPGHEGSVSNHDPEPSSGRAPMHSEEPSVLEPASSAARWKNAMFYSVSDALHAVLLTCCGHEASLKEIYTKFQDMNPHYVNVFNNKGPLVVEMQHMGNSCRSRIRTTLCRHRHRFERVDRVGTYRLRNNAQSRQPPPTVPQHELRALDKMRTKCKKADSGDSEAASESLPIPSRSPVSSLSGSRGSIPASAPPLPVSAALFQASEGLASRDNVSLFPHMLPHMAPSMVPAPSGLADAPLLSSTSASQLPQPQGIFARLDGKSMGGYSQGWGVGLMPDDLGGEGLQGLLSVAGVPMGGGEVPLSVSVGSAPSVTASNPLLAPATASQGLEACLGMTGEELLGDLVSPGPPPRRPLPASLLRPPPPPASAPLPASLLRPPPPPASAPLPASLLLPVPAPASAPLHAQTRSGSGGGRRGLFGDSLGSVPIDGHILPAIPPPQPPSKAAPSGLHPGLIPSSLGPAASLGGVISQGYDGNTLRRVSGPGLDGTSELVGSLVPSSRPAEGLHSSGLPQPSPSVRDLLQQGAPPPMPVDPTAGAGSMEVDEAVNGVLERGSLMHWGMWLFQSGSNATFLMQEFLEEAHAASAGAAGLRRHILSPLLPADASMSGQQWEWLDRPLVRQMGVAVVVIVGTVLTTVSGGRKPLQRLRLVLDGGGAARTWQQALERLLCVGYCLLGLAYALLVALSNHIRADSSRDIIQKLPLGGKLALPGCLLVCFTKLFRRRCTDSLHLQRMLAQHRGLFAVVVGVYLAVLGILQFEGTQWIESRARRTVLPGLGLLALSFYSSKPSEHRLMLQVVVTFGLIRMLWIGFVHVGCWEAEHERLQDCLLEAALFVLTPCLVYPLLAPSPGAPVATQPVKF